MDTVWVCCKLPSGLYIHNSDVEEVEHDDGSKSRVATNSERYLLNGPAAQRRLESGGKVIGEAPNVVGGFGLTEVPRAFWDRWWAENADIKHGGKAKRCYAPIAAGLIFAKPKEKDARAQAREMKDVRSGFEPLVPPDVDRSGKLVNSPDPRLPRSPVTTADAR